MKISELIKLLEEYKSVNGDHEVRKESYQDRMDIVPAGYPEIKKIFKVNNPYRKVFSSDPPSEFLCIR